MNQSTKILGFLAVAFLIFITTRGELPTYLGFLLGAGQGAAATPKADASSVDTSKTVQQSQSGSGAGFSASDVAHIALDAVMLL